MNENEILVPDSQSVKVGSRTYKIGELGVNQQILLTRFIARTILTNQGKLKVLKEKTEKSTSNAQDLMSIFELVDAEDIYEFFGIILNEDDIDYLKGDGVLNLTNETEIIAILLEQNDFEPVKKNVARIIKALIPKEKTRMH